jgi:hypothetical protein
MKLGHHSLNFQEIFFWQWLRRLTLFKVIVTWQQLQQKHKNYHNFSGETKGISITIVATVIVFLSSFSKKTLRTQAPKVLL